MKLFGQVIRTRPGWDAPIGGWPFRGVIYNEYGQVIFEEIGGMTEEKCREAIVGIAKRIRNHEFGQFNGMFEISEESSNGS